MSAREWAKVRAARFLRDAARFSWREWALDKAEELAPTRVIADFPSVRFTAQAFMAPVGTPLPVDPETDDGWASLGLIGDSPRRLIVTEEP